MIRVRLYMRWCLSGLVIMICFGQASRAMEVLTHPEVEKLINDLAANHNYPREQLVELFSAIQVQPRVVEAIKRPFEALPWHRYRKLFVTEQHIKKGIQFWKQYESTLERAEQEYGVPKQVIVAIIGVETRYGKRMGRHSVLESLTTLLMQYPRRRSFFRSELKHFLLLAREEGLEPLSVKGSYAGAIGVPQFIASSYREYAVDFNGDRRRNLIDQPEDAIGSVANYLYRHRWRAGKPIVVDAVVRSEAGIDDYVNGRLKVNSTLATLRKAGVEASLEFNDTAGVGLLRLDNGGASQYRIAFDNFYVITKYNRSIHYALAVYELGEALRKRQVSG